MNVRLPPELEALVMDKVASGRYRDETEVISDALRLLNARDEDDPSDALLTALDEGDADFAAGRFVEVRTPQELDALFSRK